MYNRLYNLRFTSTNGESHESFAVDGHADHLIGLMKVVASGIQVNGKVTISLKEESNGAMAYAEFPNGKRLISRFQHLVASMENHPAS